MKPLHVYSIPKTKTKQTTPYHHISWVNRAASTDSIRYVLQSLLVEGKRIIATDGRRLHYYEDDYFTDVNDGIYRVVKTAKEILLIANPDAGTYPNYKAAIPSGPTEDSFTAIGYTPQERAAHIIYEMGKRDQAFLFLPYVSDVCSDKADSVKVECRGKLSPVVFKDNDRFAIVMPRRID